MVTVKVSHIREAIEAVARERSSPVYASHFRRVVHVAPPEVDDFASWLASLTDADIEALASRLEEKEGKRRPHFTAALKRARAVISRRRAIAEIPPTFPEALRWVVKVTGSFQHAADLLLDDIQTVTRHYARFAPGDPYNVAARVFAAAFRREAHE